MLQSTADKIRAVQKFLSELNDYLRSSGLTEQINELEDARVEVRFATELAIQKDGDGDYRDGYEAGYGDALTAVKQELGVK